MLIIYYRERGQIKICDGKKHISLGPNMNLQLFSPSGAVDSANFS